MVWLLRALIIKLIVRKVSNTRTIYQWRKTSGFVAFVIALALVGRVWFEGIQSIATFLGLVAAGVAVALKDPIVNLAGWAFILGRSLFRVGDRIEVDGHAGDVIDVNLFYFTLLEIGKWVQADQSTGRMIQIPNGVVFRSELINFTKGFQYIWNEIPVLVTFESNWEKAKVLLEDIVKMEAGETGKRAEHAIRRAARKFLIYYRHLTPVVYTSVENSGVLLTIRYLCRPRDRRNTTHALWERILKEFSRHSDVEFAYPTQRFYDHAGEQPPAGPPSLLPPSSPAERDAK